MTEFDCFAKSFTYLAARLPRSEFLEPFLEEATVEPLDNMKKQMGMFSKVQDQSAGLKDIDFSAVMAGMQQAIGKPSEAALQAGDVPLSEAEPDMYPCLLALCGSGYGFMKVNVMHFFIIVGAILSLSTHDKSLSLSILLSSIHYTFYCSFYNMAVVRLHSLLRECVITICLQSHVIFFRQNTFLKCGQAF